MLKTLSFLLILTSLTESSLLAQQTDSTRTREEINKEIALNFYRDLWDTNNTDRYSEYMADEYIANDIFERKGVMEPAIEQKIIADRFWENGEMDFTLDYQVAEGDLVATRWYWDYKPETLLGKIMYGDTRIAIINVLRLEDGKIVELWNHRHDIETNMTMMFTLKGLGIGLLLALIPSILAIRFGLRLKRLEA